MPFSDTALTLVVHQNLALGQKMPPMGIEPMTPGLRDQCSTTELKRLPEWTRLTAEGQRGRVV